MISWGLAAMATNVQEANILRFILKPPIIYFLHSIHTKFKYRSCILVFVQASRTRSRFFKYAILSLWLDPLSNIAELNGTLDEKWIASFVQLQLSYGLEAELGKVLDLAFYKTMISYLQFRHSNFHVSVML